MNYITCQGCPAKSQCDEAGMCCNTLVTHRYHEMTRALQHAQPAAAPGIAAAPRSPSTRSPSVPHGGLRATVWKHMDGLWEQAGKPLDIKTILGLRKTCMDELQRDGCNRSTVSCELGGWQKLRTASN